MFLWNNPGVRHVAQFIRAGLFAIGPDKWWLGATTAVAFVTGLVQMMLLFVLASVGVALSGPMNSRSFVLAHKTFSYSPGGWILFGCVLAFVLLALSAPLASLQTSLNSRAVARMRSRIIKAYLASSQSYRDTHREGYFQHLVGEYCQQVDRLTQQFASFCMAATTLTALILGGIVISPKVALLLMLAGATGIVFVAPFAQRIRNEAIDKSALKREVNARSAQMVRLAEEMSAFGVSERAGDEVEDRIARARTMQHGGNFRDALIPALYQYGTLAVILVFIEGLTVLDPGRHPSFAPLALLLIRVLTYGRQMVASMQSGGKAVPYVEILGTELRELDRHHVSQDGLSDFRFQGITWEKVNYGYPGGSLILNALCGHIAPGEAVGLAGPSGSGKSTLCRLLMKLAEPQEGRILTGATDLRDISRPAWSGIAAISLQDSKLILGSVADNIRFFRPHYSLAEVEQAARTANIHLQILELPEGYETVIGPGMRALSGGQRQRIAIARALLGQPQFLILDEPTSANDQKSESLICESLRQMKGRITMLIVSHRPAMLEICDRAYRLEAGRLAELRETPAARQNIG